MATLTRHSMVQLENFVSKDSKDMVRKLKKSMYGLKQESRQWYFKFHQVIISFGFEVNLVDDWIYHRFCGSKYIFLYVNDIFLANNNINSLHETKRFLARILRRKILVMHLRFWAYTYIETILSIFLNCHKCLYWKGF